MIEREDVDSTNIVSIGYDGDVEVLEVEFKGDKVYQYHDVPESVYIDLMSSQSKGGFFHEMIRKGGYSYTRVEV